MKKNDKTAKTTYLSRLILRLESYDITFSGYLAVFFSISFLRNFLEGAMENMHNIGTGATQDTTILQMGVLFNLEWMTLFCALALVLRAFAKTDLVRLLKLMLFCFAWINIVPLIDVFAYHPSGCKIDYLYTLKDYAKALGFFFVPGVDVHICLGIRLEVFAAFAACWAFVFIKTKNFLRSSLASILLYFLAVSSMAYPVFILLPAMPFVPKYDALINNFFFGASYGGEFLRRNSVMIFILLVPILLCLYRVHAGTKKFTEYIKTFLSPLSMVLASSFLCGFLLAPIRQGLAVFQNPYDYFMLLSGVLTCLIFGLYLDAVSEGSGSVSYAPFYAILVLISSMAVSFDFFLFCILLFVITIFYSLPPYKAGLSGFFSRVRYPLYASVLLLAGSSVINGAGFLSKLNFAVPGLVFASLLIISFASLYDNNTALLTALFFSCALLAPAAASLTLLIPAILAGALMIAAAKMSKTREERSDRLSLIFAALVVLTGILGR